jgi:hypothetical protein
MEEMRASIRAYIENLPRRANTSPTPFAPSAVPALLDLSHLKQVYRSKGKGRGKRTKVIVV